MSDHYLYDPDICDGNVCIGDCDSCHHADEIFEKMEQDEKSERKEK